MKRIINGQEFTRIRYFANGREFETWYPTENLAYLAGRASFWVATGETL